MTWNFTPFAFLLLIPGLVSVAFAIYAWRRGRLSTTSPFMFLTISSALWALIHVGEIMGADLSTKLFWAKAQYLGSVFVPVAWLTVGLQFTNRKRWLTLRSLVGLSIVPVCVLVLTWTNDWHGLIWEETRIKEAGPFSVLGVTHGPAFWIWVAYSYGLLVVGTGCLLTMVIRSPRFYLGQRLALISSVMFPWLANAAYLQGWGPPFDLTPFAFALSCVALTYGIVQFQLLDIVPLARDLVLENMADALFVLDMDNRVVDINPAASRLLDRPARALLGLPIGQVVGPQPDFNPGEFEKDFAQAELELGTGTKRTILAADISLLRDSQGEPAGRLMVCRDITQRKRAVEATSLRTRARELVAEATASFLVVSPDEVDGLIEKTLGEIGEFTESERCWFSTFDIRTSENIDNFEWNAPGISPDVRKDPDAPFEEYTWGMEEIRKNGMLLIPSVKNLPPEARAEREALESQGVKSCLLIAVTLVWKNRAITAFMGLDAVRSERTWDKGAARLLNAVGDVVVGALYRKRAQQEIEESETMLAKAQRIAHIGNFVRDLRTNKIQASDEIFAIHGTPREKFDSTFATFLSLVHAEDRENLQRVVAKSIQEHTSYRMDYRIVRPDGEIRHVHARADITYSETGEALRLTGTVQDITERKQSEEALRESAENYRELTDLLPLTVWECDLDGKFTFVNGAVSHFFGYETEEVIDRIKIQDTVVEDQRPLAELQLRKSATGVNVPSAEFLFLRKDGSTFPGIVSASRIVRDGTITGFRGTVLDITERKRAEDDKRKMESQIEHMQKLESLGVLAGGIAHDFNNLLLGILGNAELARIQTSTKDKRHEFLDQVVKSARRAADLCKQLLAYSGKGNYAVQQVDLSQLVEDMAHLLKISISKKVRLDYRFEADLPVVEGDAGQIRQIVMNFIMNASEAIGDETGSIMVSTGVMNCDRRYLSDTYLDDDLPEGRYVYMQVADTGQGMNEETQRRLFDPFFTTKATGRGLGLAAVLGIVRGHRGAIKLLSLPGNGTDIRVLFPASESVVVPEEPQPKSEEDPWKGSGTILVVDDEEMIRTFCRKTLEMAGHRVMTASDGLEGVELYHDHHKEIDAVVLDMTMPNLSGEETLREMLRINEDVRVVLSSGYTEPGASARAHEGGFTVFLQKPYPPKKLLEMVQQVMTAGEAFRK